MSCHVEKRKGFILFNMGFQKFKHRHEKHALNFGNNNFLIQNPKNKVILLIRIEKKR
jgi:hypothetical protein